MIDIQLCPWWTVCLDDVDELWNGMMVMETLLLKKNNNKIVTEMTYQGVRFQVREKPDKPRWVILDMS